MTAVCAAVFGASFTAFGAWFMFACSLGSLGSLGHGVAQCLGKAFRQKQRSQFPGAAPHMNSIELKNDLNVGRDQSGSNEKIPR